MAKRREKGDGSIYQRDSDGLYVAYARLENGKRRYVYSKTRGEVVKKLKALQRNIQQKTLVTAKSETVQAFLQYWLDLRKGTKKIKESTAVCYASHLCRVYPLIGHVKLQKLTGDQIQVLYNTLQEQKQSPNTIKLIHSILSTAFKDAIRWKRLASNPCKDIDAPVWERHDVNALTPEQTQTLLTAAKGHSLECFLTLALATGMRRGELLGLRWSDIDLDAKTLKVQRTASYLPDETGKHRMVETTPKTKSGKRVITLAQFAINALKAQKVKQLEQRLQAGGSWMNKDLVFCSAIGDYYVVTSLTHQFKILLKKAELPPMRVHDLRHSAATLLLKMGVPAKVVQEILGHSSIVITMDVYSHILPGMQQSAMDQLDGLFLQAQ